MSKLKDIKDYQDLHQGEATNEEELDDIIYKNLSKDDLFEDAIGTIED